MNDLKALLILGPQHEGYDEISGLLEAYQYPGFRAIGDGIRDIKLSELTSIFRAEVSSNTRIDILAHGNVIRGQHVILLDTQQKATTRFIFKHFAEATDYSPLKNIHLWSCYAGAAVKDITAFAQGSQLITHAPATGPSSVNLHMYAITTIILGLRQMEDDTTQNVYAHFLQYVPVHSVSTSIFSIVSRSDVKIFEINPDLTTLLSSPKNTLLDIKRDFQNFLIQNNIDEDLSHIQYTKNDIQVFATGSLLYRVGVCDPTFTSALNAGYIIPKEWLRMHPTGFALLPTLDDSNITSVECKKTLEALLEQGAPVHLATPSSINPILTVMVNRGEYDVVELLLKHKIDPNAISTNGDTALRVAAHKGDVSMIKLLCDHGANPNQVSLNGYVPLISAICKQHIDAAQTLLDRGADPCKSVSCHDQEFRIIDDIDILCHYSSDMRNLLYTHEASEACR